MDDLVLVARARAGDMDAASLLLSRYQDVAYSVALRLMGSAAEAEDLAQDALVRAYTRLSDLEDGASFSGWIRRITVNLSLNAMRRRGQLLVETFEAGDGNGRTSPTQLEAPELTPEETALQRALQSDIDALLKQLPPEQRVAVVLRDMYGYGVAEVAAAQQCGLSAAKMRLTRGRASLRRLLTEARISLDGHGE